MITGTHAVIYSQDAAAARVFFRDVLGLPHVDAGNGWLIFKLPPAEVGFHPTGSQGPPDGSHELFLMCDDIEGTVRDLRGKGVEFTSPVENAGFGRLTRFRIPGGGEISLYQPRHPNAGDL